MRCTQYLGIVVFGACVSAASSNRTTTHVNNAKAALAAGNYAGAEAEYEYAVKSADDFDRGWADSEKRYGMSRIEVKRIHAQVPGLRASTKPPAEVIEEVHKLRAKLRVNGGDDTVEQDLVGTITVQADRWVAEAEKRANAGEVFQAAYDVTPLYAFRDVDAAVLARATALRKAAADAAIARATAAGSARPLSERLHRGHAARFGGAAVGDGSAVLAPFGRNVDVIVEAPAGCAMNALSSLAQKAPGNRAAAQVRVNITTCTGSTDTTTSQQIATWMEDVFVGMETITVTEEKCEEVCGSVLSGGETCNTSYATSQPTLVCTKNTITKCFPQCRPVQVKKEVPRYEPKEFKQPRTLTTEKSSIQIDGTWTVTRNGKDQTGTINSRASNTYSSAPIVGKAPPFEQGTKRSPDDLATSATESTASSLKSALNIAFAPDIEAAVAAAKAASGRIDDEEEAWIKALVLGGSDAGPLTARYNLEASAAMALFQPQSYAVPEAPWLPEVQTIVIPERGAARKSEDTLEVSLPTFGNGGKYWIQFDGAYRSLPLVMSASGTEIAGDSAMLAGVTAATRVLARKSSPWGAQIADELAMGFALGRRAGGADVIDNSLAAFAGTVSIHYALGGGVRKIRKGALFAGVRAQYEAFLIGTSTGSYTSLPLFVRAEKTFNVGSLVLEGTGLAVAGGSHWGLALHWTNLRINDLVRKKYFQLRIENTTVDATSTDVGDTSSMNGERMLEDVGLTTVHIMYGIAW